MALVVMYGNTMKLKYNYKIYITCTLYMVVHVLLSRFLWSRQIENNFHANKSVFFFNFYSSKQKN